MSDDDRFSHELAHDEESNVRLKSTCKRRGLPQLCSNEVRRVGPGNQTFAVTACLAGSPNSGYILSFEATVGAVLAVE